MSSRRLLLPGDRSTGQSPSGVLAPGEALTPAERSLLDALRRPGRKTVRVDTTDEGPRGLEVEELIPVHGLAEAGVLARVRSLLAEALFQDITLRQADGRIVSLRRVLRARFPG